MRKRTLLALLFLFAATAAVGLGMVYLPLAPISLGSAGVWASLHLFDVEE